MTAHRILIIEDEQDLLELYRMSLEKAGFEVHTAKNGIEGISASLQKKPELILLDLMMPMAGGKDVLSMIQLNAEINTVPIIIISNLDPGSIDLSHYEDQIMDYWVKSELTPNTLTEKLVDYFS